MRENFCPIINFVLSVQYTPYVQKLPPPCPILVYHFIDGGRRPSGRPGKGSPVASPYSVGVGVVTGGGWIPDVIGCRVQDGMKMNPPGGRDGRAFGAPLQRWGRGCGWRRMDCGCRGSGDGGWNENEPSGGPGTGVPLARPYSVGVGVCMTGRGCVRWLGCMRGFDTNGVGVPRRGTLPGLRSGLFPSKKTGPGRDLFFSFFIPL